MRIKLKITDEKVEVVNADTGEKIDFVTEIKIHLTPQRQEFTLRIACPNSVGEIDVLRNFESITESK